MKVMLLSKNNNILHFHNKDGIAHCNKDYYEDKIMNKLLEDYNKIKDTNYDSLFIGFNKIYDENNILIDLDPLTIRNNYNYYNNIIMEKLYPDIYAINSLYTVVLDIPDDIVLEINYINFINYCKKEILDWNSIYDKNNSYKGLVAFPYIEFKNVKSMYTNQIILNKVFKPIAVK